MSPKVSPATVDDAAYWGQISTTNLQARKQTTHLVENLVSIEHLGRVG